MAERKKITLKKTAAGAQQKGTYSSTNKAARKVFNDVKNLTPAEFRKKYNMPKNEAILLMGAAVQASLSQEREKRTGQPSFYADMYERQGSSERLRLKNKRLKKK
jgi:hypothetical protein